MLTNHWSQLLIGPSLPQHDDFRENQPYYEDASEGSPTLLSCSDEEEESVYSVSNASSEMNIVRVPGRGRDKLKRINNINKNSRRKCLMSDFKKIINVVGSVIPKEDDPNSKCSLKQLQRILFEKRRSYFNMCKRKGNKIKKMIISRGGDEDEAINQQFNFIQDEKEKLKKLLARVQIHAVDEILCRSLL